MEPYILYAFPGSLYSSKARSYLLSHGIRYIERAPGHPRYNDVVVPAIGRWIIPVLETPDGELIQDTVNIIDFLDARRTEGPSVYPESPLQRVTSLVLDYFGGEGLLRPAMHYRWNFDDVNVPFLVNDFSGAMALGADEDMRKAVFDFASGRMRSAAVSFGVVPEHFAAIEESYLEFLSLFASHLEGSPFLLGGRPTVADHGFMGPLYAHLARDPYPQRLMQHNAWRVWRWVERMNRGGADAGEYGDVDGELFPDDSLPESLLALLRFVGEEYIDETIALVGAIDSHLAEHSDIVEGDIVGGKPTRRMTGEVTFSWRGRDMTVAVVPYRIFMIQRIQDALADLSTPEQDRVRSTLEPLGIGPLLDLKPRRRVNRDDNREVWGPEQEPFLLG